MRGWKIVFWTPAEIEAELATAVKDGWDIAHAPTVVPAVGEDNKPIVLLMVTLVKQPPVLPDQHNASPMRMRG